AESLRADLPPAIGAAIDKCVAKQPDDRFATAELLVDAIDAAQACAPEVPLAVRLFANELSTGRLVVFFLVMMPPLLARGMSSSGDLDAIIPMIMIGAVAVTRVALSFGSSRRLMEDGFTPDEVLAGMAAVAAERSVVRDAYRANPEIRRR